MTAISVEELQKTYRSGFIPRRRVALRGIGLEVANGEIFGFLGPNGAGKTTTIKAVIGLIRPTGGRVRILGHPAGSVAANRHIGYLPENPYFHQYLKAAEFLRFCADLCDVPRGVLAGRIAELLRLVGLERDAGLPIRKFSKGMVQRLGLAQALINDPDILVLDEPLSGLDPIGRKEFRDIILDMRGRGKTVFFSSHILQDAEMICDRAAILVGGIIRRCGKLDELRSGEISGFEISLTGCDAGSAAAFGEVVTTQDRMILIRVPDAARLEDAIGRIRSAGGTIASIVPTRRTLEEVFMVEVNAGRSERAGGEG